MLLRTTSTHPVRRTLLTLAAAASLALSLGTTGCMDTGGDGELQAAVDCSKIEAWTPVVVVAGKPSTTRKSYNKDDLVQFKGSEFRARSPHVVIADNWDPIGAASLWEQAGECTAAPAAGGSGDVVNPPPPLPNNGGGGGAIGAGGVFDADIKALIDERFFILSVSAKSDPARNFTQVTNVGRAGMQDIKSLIASGAAKITTGTGNGFEEVVVTVGAERRLQIRRFRAQGLIEGVMVGAATDAKAPFAMSVGNLNGMLTHTVVVDVGNNLKNDLRGTGSVNNQVAETGALDSALQQNGGLHAFPEGIKIVTDLKFPGIKGF